MFNNFFAPAFTSAFGNDFADMLRSIAGPITGAGSSVHAYRYSDETGETLVFDLPGCKKEDLDLAVQGRKFIVKRVNVLSARLKCRTKPRLPRRMTSNTPSTRMLTVY